MPPILSPGNVEASSQHQHHSSTRYLSQAAFKHAAEIDVAEDNGQHHFRDDASWEEEGVNGRLTTVQPGPSVDNVHKHGRGHTEFQSATGSLHDMVQSPSGTNLLGDRDHTNSTNPSRRLPQYHNAHLSPSLSSSSSIAQIERSATSRKDAHLDRTKSWLSQVLGPPQRADLRKTSLTQRKFRRNRDSRDTQLRPSISRSSRVTTFSAENAADAAALEAVMKDTERLLNEAMAITCQVSSAPTCPHGSMVTELEQDAAIASGNPSPRSPTIVSRSTGSKQSRGEYPTQQDQDSEPQSFVSNELGVGHRRVLPLRSLGRHGIPSANSNSNNVTIPAFPETMTSLHLMKTQDPCHVRKHTSANKTHGCKSRKSPITQQAPAANKLSYHSTHHLTSVGISVRDRHVADDETKGFRVFHPHHAATESEIFETPHICPCGAQYSTWNLGGLDGSTSDDVIELRRISNRDGMHSTKHQVPRDVLRSHWKITGQSVASRRGSSRRSQLSLRQRSHVSLQPGRKFSMSKSLKKKPIARDWPIARKRLAAAVACFNTALIGLLAGVYSGVLPSIQYMVVDLDHSMVFGNVAFYFGMAMTSFFCWPLPLLHGRKPYIVCSLGIALPLLFPQALAVTEPRSPSAPLWKLAILIPRTFLGLAMGLTSMNCHATLTDLFGSSLMSTKPHQEVVDDRDMRRHGGGLGAWLGLWTWCFVGAIATGFLIGGIVIDNMRPSTGFYICIGMTACGLIMNVLCPEVRRANWRRSVSEVRTGQTISRRLARGEIMMHRVHDGPIWWGQEVYHGVALSLEMLRQPGFAVMALFASWIYAQVVLTIIVSNYTTPSQAMRANLIVLL